MSWLSKTGAYLGGVGNALIGRSEPKGIDPAIMAAGFRTALGGLSGLLSSGPERTVAMWLDLFGKHPWIHTCVNRIAEDMAALRWRLYQLEDGDPGPNGNQPRRAVWKHEMLNIWKQPNPMMVGWVWRYLIQSFLELSGEGPVLIQRPEFGSKKVQALWPIPPHWVQGLPTAEEPYFTLWLAGRTYTVAPTEIIWIYKPNPFSPYGRGLGSVRAINDATTAYELMTKYTAAFYRNNAQPGGIVMVPGMKPADAKILREEWEATHQGVMNAFRMAFLGYTEIGGKTEYHNTSSNHEEMQLHAGKDQERDTIVQAGFGLSPEKLGILENSNKATIEAAELQHQTNILRPRAMFQIETYGAYLVPLFGDNLEFEPEDPVQETKRWKAEHAVSLWQGGLATKNEGRIANDLPLDPHGDVYREDLNAEFVSGDKSADDDTTQAEGKSDETPAKTKNKKRSDKRSAAMCMVNSIRSLRRKVAV